MLKSESSFPSVLNILKIIGIIPSFIISILGYLEKENLCNIPKIGLRQLPYSRQLLKKLTKFYTNLLDLVKYCKPSPSVVMISISFI